MERNKTKDRVADCFNSLQLLENVPVTPHNASILNGVYDQLKIIYEEVGEMENARTDRAAAGTE